MKKEKEFKKIRIDIGDGQVFDVVYWPEKGHAIFDSTDRKMTFEAFFQTRSKEEGLDDGRETGGRLKCKRT